jgi:hypothetical protein
MVAGSEVGRNGWKVQATCQWLQLSDSTGYDKAALQKHHRGAIIAPYW